MNLKLTLSIGLKMELLPLLRTKDNADHAGLSPQLVPSKVSTSNKPVNYYLSPNKLWLTVHTMEIWVATVVSWTMLSPMLKKTVSLSNPNTLTLPEMVNVEDTNLT